MFRINQTERPFIPITRFFSTPLWLRNAWKDSMFAFCTTWLTCCILPSLSYRKRMHWARGGGGSLGYAWPMRMQQKTEINYKPTRFYMCEDVERWMRRIFKSCSKLWVGEEHYIGGKAACWSCVLLDSGMAWHAHHHNHHHHHHHSTTTTCHGAARMENTMEDFHSAFWLDGILSGGGVGVGVERVKESM